MDPTRDIDKALPDDPPPAEESPKPDEQRFPCASCGAKLVFAPGTDTLTCPYCRAVNEIEAGRTEIVELDFRVHLERLADHAESVDRIVSHCERCGAEVELPDNVGLATGDGAL